MENSMNIEKFFTSKRSALDFMQFLSSDRIVLDSVEGGYKVIYAGVRSVIDSEVVNNKEYDPIITS